MIKFQWFKFQIPESKLMPNVTLSEAEGPKNKLIPNVILSEAEGHPERGRWAKSQLIPNVSLSEVEELNVFNINDFK